jgi:SAM-dependent methyltransferase
MRILSEHEREIEVLEQHLKLQARGGTVLQILEAGCGRKWYFTMDQIPFELTGVDLDAAAMEARITRQKDLTRMIVGDLRTVQLGPNSYDVIYNAYVLEHVSDAEKVLENFVRWLKPGGILILTVPDRDSVHGFMTRLLPFSIHVLYYKLAWGLKEAGKPGFAPYPTVYDPVVSRRGLREFSEKHRLTIREEFGFGSYRRGRGIFKTLTPLFANA